MIGVGRKTNAMSTSPASEKNVAYYRIIVPVHGTEADKHAIELAGMIGGGKQAELVLVHVVEVAQALPLEADMPIEVGHGENALRDAENSAKSATSRIGRVTPELLQARSAGAAIVDEAVERGADVIVMALCQHMRHGQPTGGSTVPYVLQNAPCEVIVTRLPSDIAWNNES
jgi:nucleotide-binding universal stress UspA family protein